MNKDTIYLLALHSVNGLGSVRIKILIDYFQDLKLAWEASTSELLKIGIPKNAVENLIKARKSLDPQKYLEEINKLGIKYLTFFDEDYPKLLKEILNPPLILYYKGKLVPNEKCVAVVGTRKMTSYGKIVTEKFTQELAENGLTIVSGLARGVDTQVHKTTLQNNGRTIAVLGGGLKNIFPPENQKLAEDVVVQNGAIVSEYPPNEPSLPGNFPARNRIISGMSLGVLVTEADIESGSLITAKLAVEQGREVFAVPGSITSQFSKGPISLIQEGAKAVTEAKEILEELGINLGKRRKREEIEIEATPEEKQILDILENEQVHIDELARILNKPISYVSAAVLKMEISGLVCSLGAGIYSKT